jgi:hypothetical protein
MGINSEFKGLRELEWLWDTYFETLLWLRWWHMLEVSHNSNDELYYSSPSAVDNFQVSKFGDFVVLGLNKWPYALSQLLFLEKLNLNLNICFGLNK